MKPAVTLASVAAATLLLASSVRGQASCAPAILETRFSRILPHGFVDQAIESIPQVTPGAHLLVSHRTGQVGSVEYGLVAYSPAAGSDSVLIQGVAVTGGHAPKAWEFTTTCSMPEWLEGLLRTLEAISHLK